MKNNQEKRGIILITDNFRIGTGIDLFEISTLIILFPEHCYVTFCLDLYVMAVILLSV